MQPLIIGNDPRLLELRGVFNINYLHKDGTHVVTTLLRSIDFMLKKL